MVQVSILGCGDAFGSGGRLNSCFLVESPAGRLLLDFGTTGLISLKRQGIDPNTIDAILISHLHGDHFGGLPFFLLDAKWASSRNTPILLAGPPGLEARTQQLMEIMYPEVWGLITDQHPQVLTLLPEKPLNILDWEVKVWPVPHPSGAPSYALRLVGSDHIVAYSGDTGWTDHLFAVADGADLFICECNQYDEPLANHLDYPTLRKHYSQLNCKQILLTHLGTRMLDHKDQLIFPVAQAGKVYQL